LDINFGIKPFWFWNGKMDNRMIVKQIEEMREKGIGGFFIHPRQGLEVPYLSEEWFEKVSIAVEAAKKRGMEVWLYDEYPYPSGIAAGEVTIGNPEYQAFMMDYQVVDGEESKDIVLSLPMSDIILARAYRMKGEKIIWEEYIDLKDFTGIVYTEDIYQESGLTVYNKKRFFVGNSAKIFRWSPPPGNWKVFLFYQYPLKDFKYFGTFIDPLNRDAVKHFIQTTHEEYKKHFSHEFGRTIKGIFTDETAPSGGRIPWSREIPALFRKKYGYDLTENLPRLINVDVYDDLSSRLKYQYWKLVVDTFIESYDMQISDWCHKNNLLYAGEKPILRPYQLAFMDIPGVDTGHQKAGDSLCIFSENYRATPKVASSAAHFYGKERALCECFHSIGWSMSIQDMKFIFDQLIFSGINMFVPHAYFYTADGLKKHDAPPSSFFQMPWWRYQGILSEYVSNHARILSESKRKVDVLLLDQTPSRWTLFSGGGFREKLSRDFCNIQSELLRNNMDYYIIDQTLLKDFHPENGKICYRDEQFEVLIVPPVTNIERDAWTKIKEFILADCKVIFTGCLPYQKIEDGDIQRDVEEIFKINPVRLAEDYFQDESSGEINIHSTLFIDKVSNLREGIRSLYTPYLEISSYPEDEFPLLSAYFERDRGNNLLFLVNPSTSRKDCLIRLKDDEKDILSVSLPDIGDLWLPFQTLDDGTRGIAITFAPFQSYLVEFRRDKIVETADQIDFNECRIDLDSEWDISLEHLNPLRIDDWSLEIVLADGEKVFGRSSETVNGKPVIDQIEELNIPVPVRTQGAFGTPRRIIFSEFEAIYSYSFYSELENPELWLVIEDGSISGDFHIEINQGNILPDQFESKTFYSPTNLATSVGRYLRKGENSIRVCVKVRKTSDGLLTPIYLFGNIGVVRSGDYWCMTELPAKGYFGKNTENRIPFYAGEIIYEKEIEFNPDTDYVKFYIGDRIDSVVSLFINNVYLGTGCWSPYEWIVPRNLIEEKLRIKLEIPTTLLALFEGETIDIKTHKISKI